MVRKCSAMPGLRRLAVEVVRVDVGVAEGVDEVAGGQAGDVGDQVGEQGVAGDVERDAEEEVGRPLVELAREPAVGHVELEERVARRQRHLGDVGRVPGRDDQPAADRRVGSALTAWIPSIRLRDLVDRPAVRGVPRPPLLAVDRAELAVLVGPLVPDRDLVLPQVGDVGRAAEEPDQLVDDRAEGDLLGGDERKPLAQVEPDLAAENAERAGAGAVGLLDPVVEDSLHQVEVLPHGTDPSNRGR